MTPYLFYDQASFFLFCFFNSVLFYLFKYVSHILRVLWSLLLHSQLFLGMNVVELCSSVSRLSGWACVTLEIVCNEKQIRKCVVIDNQAYALAQECLILIN